MSADPKPRVLVVDDVPLVRQVFGRFLTLAGMAVSFATDGHEGLAVARMTVPDLIVSDLEMPRMDGVAFCAAVRADEATRRVPIVVVTGSGGVEARAALDAGCDAVLPKPCSRDLLIATIRDLLERVEETRAAAAAIAPTEPARAATATTPLRLRAGRR
jgi:two-component system, cell cycle response regulator